MPSCTDGGSSTVRKVAGGRVSFVHGEVGIEGSIGDPQSPPAVNQAASGAIRAEQIRIAGEPSRLAELNTVVEGVVSDAIFEGERVVYEVTVSALGGAVLRVFDHDPEGHSQHEIGSKVFLGWNARDVLVFA